MMWAILCVVIYYLAALTPGMSSHALFVPRDDFTNADIAFLKEYGQVMACIARALDIVQGEDRAYLGFTLPTLAVTLKKLKQTRTRHL